MAIRRQRTIVGCTFEFRLAATGQSLSAPHLVAAQCGARRAGCSARADHTLDAGALCSRGVRTHRGTQSLYRVGRGAARSTSELISPPPVAERNRSTAVRRLLV